MQRMKIHNTTAPFWQCLASFFMFPASFPTVIYLAAFAAISSLMSMEPAGLLIGAFVYYFFVSFAYTVLEYSARGELQRLHVGKSGYFFRAENIIKQLFIFFFLVGINFLVYGLSSTSIFQLSVSLTLCSFPVIAVQLVKHNNPVKMVSPAEVVASFKIMGKTYWLLSLFSIMLFLSAQLALQIVPVSPNSYMNLAINHFIVFYFSLVFFSMLGYSFYQFYDQLGLEPDSMDTDRHLPETNAMGGLIKQVNILIKEGDLEKAGKELLKVIETNPGDLNSWQRYFKILLLASNADELYRFAQEYINYLLGHGKDLEAMDIYLEVQRSIGDFRPKTGVQAFALANRLRAHGHAGLALNLLNNMHKHYRGYEGIAKAYMLAAQILCEQFGEDIKARKILNFIIKKYPQSIFANEATDYLKVVDRLAVR